MGKISRYALKQYRVGRFDEVEAVLMVRKGEIGVVIREYPSEIKKLMDIWEPYGLQLSRDELDNVPREVAEAYEKCKKWSWEQGQ